MLDPACGSGHILVEAYDLLKEIYLERGYRLRDIPRLILGKNLFGLDIDDRAAQLASFALLMKARADDRRIFEPVSGGQWPVAGSDSLPTTDHRPPTTTAVNVLTIPDSSALSLRPHQLAETLFSDKARRGSIPIRQSNYMFGEMEAQPSLLMLEDAPTTNHRTPTTEQHIIELLESFEMGKTLGSLIRLPADYGATLAAIAELIADKSANGDIYEKIAARQIEPFVRAAELLHAKYDCVIANPPYMGGKGMNAAVKEFAKRQFPDSKSDLFAMFIERGFEMAKPEGFNAMVTMQSWMFLSSFESMRERLFDEKTIECMVHMANGVMGIAFGTNATVWRNQFLQKHKGGFSFVAYEDLNEEGIPFEFPVENERLKTASREDFKMIPGSPVAYWISDKFRSLFSDKLILHVSLSDGQNITANNEKYVRHYWEVAARLVGCERKWIFYAKGGDFRKWYGNLEFIVDWSVEARDNYSRNSSARIIPSYLWFREGITWSRVSSASQSFRLLTNNSTFDKVGSSIFFTNDQDIPYTLGLLNSTVSQPVFKMLNPTFDLQVRDVRNVPLSVSNSRTMIEANVNVLLQMSRNDWDSFETSWDFQTFPLLRTDLKAATIEQSFLNWQHACQANIQRMQELETENNRLFIDAYGLQDELSPDVPEAQITLARADRSDDTRRLLSYALGCVMGRYSLDRAGLVYADSGNQDFEKIYYSTTDFTESTDEKQAASSAPSIVISTKGANVMDENQSVSSVLSVVHFPPDADGIVPVTEIEWFVDDAANRLVEFVGKAWRPGYAGVPACSDVAAITPESMQSFEQDQQAGTPAYPEQSFEQDQQAGTPAYPEQSFEQDQQARTPAYPELEANLRWIAESLGTTRDEDARTTIRRYFAAGFFKDHLKTYKKRPIYWLFSSGKQRAFQCLVYLHRYNEGTLARMRTEYVIPLQGKIAARIAQLENDKEAATSTSHRKKLEKEQDSLKKQQTELISFDEKLRHYADQRIALDLDDGVKVNYGKFGDLLAEVKAVTGGSEE